MPISRKANNGSRSQTSRESKRCCFVLVFLRGMPLQRPVCRGATITLDSRSTDGWCRGPSRVSYRLATSALQARGPRPWTGRGNRCLGLGSRRHHYPRKPSKAGLSGRPLRIARERTGASRCRGARDFARSNGYYHSRLNLRCLGTVEGDGGRRYPCKMGLEKPVEDMKAWCMRILRVPQHPCGNGGRCEAAAPDHGAGRARHTG